MGVSYQGSVDLTALPGDLYVTVQTQLSEKNLLRVSKAEKHQFVSGSVTYEFQYEDSMQKFIIDERQVDEELLELIDKLMPYLQYK